MRCSAPRGTSRIGASSTGSRWSPFLAWVGLGADGLSSSAYGPEEAFKALGEHRYLALVLAALMATTVLLISAAYRRIIEEFPSGGGGYVVAVQAARPLGRRGIGLRAAGRLRPHHHHLASPRPETRSSASCPPSGTAPSCRSRCVLTLAAHDPEHPRRAGVGAGAAAGLPALPGHPRARSSGAASCCTRRTSRPPSAHVREGYRQGISTLGAGGLLLLFIRAYSLGGGTYTGIEAVSNGLPIMREPQGTDGKRTMVYMAHLARLHRVGAAALLPAVPDRARRRARR